MSKREKLKLRDFFFLNQGSNHVPPQFIVQMFNVFEDYHSLYTKLHMEKIITTVIFIQK